MAPQLTPNAISMLYNQTSGEGFEPWLQVIDTRQIRPSSTGTNPNNRYRVVVSDGKHYVSGMLATQLNSLMESQKIQKNSIIQLKDFITNRVQNRKIIIVLGIENIIPSNERIGDPQSIEPNAQSTVPPVAPQPHAVVTNQNAPTQFSNYPNSNISSSYTAAPQQQPQSAPTSYMKPPTPAYSSSSAPVVRDDPNIRLSDIDSLNPYFGGRWTIKARVTNRAPIKHWSNARGEGKLFSLELLDSKGGEIRATMFNDAVDKFYELLKPGGIFYFSGGKIKMANRKYTSVNNDYEITFDSNSEIRLAPDDASIQTIHYNFKKIANIESLPVDSNIDLIGIVKDVGNCQELTSKSGKQLHKRDVVIMDDSMAEVKITMWNERAQESCDGWSNNVLAIKGCRVSEFNGRSIGTFSSTNFSVNPDIREAGQLTNWYNSNGGNPGSIATKSLSTSMGGFGGGSMGSFEDRHLISDIKDKQLGFNQKPDYITVKGTISFIKHDNGAWYQACTKCQKKVVEGINQDYRCEKCQMSYSTCENRYIMSITVQDHSGNAWATCFNEQGKIIMNGKTADEMSELNNGNSSAYEACFKEAIFKEYIFKLRVKAEQVQEELRVKSSVVSLEPVNYIQESKDLLEAIAKYN